MTGNTQPPTLTLGQSVRRVLDTLLGAMQNRGELFALELREEGMRIAEMLFWTAAAVLLAGLGIIVLTAAIIFLFREDLRVYAAGGFALLYLGGAVWAFFGAKSLLKTHVQPFEATLDQLNKDRQWLDSLK